MSVAAWNLLGGLDWHGIEAAAEMLGIEDLDGLVTDLAGIRDFQTERP